MSQVYKHAIVGSRDWPQGRKQEIAIRVNDCFNLWGNDWILVSGGSDGVNFVAEQTAMEFGLPVISFRVSEITPNNMSDREYVVDEWRMHRGRGTVIRTEPTWADWLSAVGYKSMLIAERVESADAFHFNGSRGTAYEIECFEHEGVPVEVTT